MAVTNPKTGVTLDMESMAAIHELAAVVYLDWKNINYAAAPYLDAMRSLTFVSDNYGQDSGDMIVAYFLSNARSWTGPVAKAVKAELNRRIA